MTVMSMVLPVITAAAMGAGFVRLTFLMFDLFEDENGGTMDARIAALDTLMRRMVKPKTIVTSADGDDATGVYRAAAWPAISVKDLFYAEVDKNCGPACVTHPEDQDEGPVKFVRESQFTKRLIGAPPSRRRPWLPSPGSVKTVRPGALLKEKVKKLNKAESRQTKKGAGADRRGTDRGGGRRRPAA